MSIQKTECFVLRRIPFRETSWILTVLTKSSGKLKGIVKGARQEKSKWLSACELLAHSKMLFFEKTKTNLHLITDMSVIDSHLILRSHFSRLTYASYFAELLDLLLEENDAQEGIFELLASVLSVLEEDLRSFDVLARAFEVKLLAALGLLPHFEQCLGCGRRAVERAHFSSRYGGIFCHSCHEKKQSGFLISRGCLQAIRFLLHYDLKRGSRMRVGEQIGKELAQIMKQFIEFRLDRRIKSLHFMSQVAPILKRRNFVTY